LCDTSLLLRKMNVRLALNILSPSGLSKHAL
jgi:hypothetical protein